MTDETTPADRYGAGVDGAGGWAYCGPQSIGTATINRPSGTIYDPCPVGLHVCGADDDDAAATVLNVPCSTKEEARALFEWAKVECAVQGDETTDLVVDLNLHPDDGPDEDFCMTRQMLGRFASLCGVTAPAHPWMSMRWHSTLATGGTHD